MGLALAGRGPGPDLVLVLERTQPRPQVIVRIMPPADVRGWRVRSELGRLSENFQLFLQGPVIVLRGADVEVIGMTAEEDLRLEGLDVHADVAYAVGRFTRADERSELDVDLWQISKHLQNLRRHLHQRSVRVVPDEAEIRIGHPELIEHADRTTVQER